MAEGQTTTGSGRPRRRRRRRRVAAVVVVLALAAAALGYRFDLVHRWFGAGRPPAAAPAPPAAPAATGSPTATPAPALRLPARGPAAAVAAATTPARVDPAAVRRAVAALAHSRKLGRHVAVDVAQLSDGAVVYRRGSGPVTPASTMKLLTTVAALDTLGPDHRFSTSVVAPRGSARVGRVVLVGGGDPLLTRSPSTRRGYPPQADLTTLARRTARTLHRQGHHAVRVGYDASLFTGPAVDPHWEPSYLPDDVVSPISSLWVDEGREHAGLAARSDDPARAAGRAFARALSRQHVTVRGAPAPAALSPARSRVLARVSSAPLAEIVQHVVELSDNEGAEVLARQVALAKGRPASFAGAVSAVREVLASLGVTTRGDRILDGSGLSRQDRLRPGTLLRLIRTASAEDHPELRSAVADLPVAGFTGSLASRFLTGSPLGPGLVRAKTGTLTGVHGLAGTVTSRDGAVMEFVAIADKVRPVNTLDARARLDDIAAALAGCACARR